MATAKKRAILFGAMETLEREGCSEEEMTKLLVILGQKRSVVREVACLKREVDRYRRTLIDVKTA